MNTVKLFKTDTNAFRAEWIAYVQGLQETICAALETADGSAKFNRDEWDRNEDGKGGGGITRVLENGSHIEKGGVNTSVVYGRVSDAMRRQLNIDGHNWFACGLSLVIHPLNPYAPTVHANWRFFELYDEDGLVCDRWFGGGTDLTPYYLFEEDAVHFHGTIKSALDHTDPSLYPDYKKVCDEYFSNSHRENETRGIGGVFYDHLRPAGEADADRLFAFQKQNADSFIDAYLPILEKRKNTPYGEREVKWQEIRRGRYVEFNLLHDRGTVFGLKTKGRTESILMSLPPRARWVYDYTPEPGSAEDRLFQVCLRPRDWV